MKKGFLKTIANSFERRLNSETSENNRFLNQLTPEIQKAVNKAASDDSIVDEEVTKFMLKYKVDHNPKSISEAINKINDNKNITKVKKISLIQNITQKVADFETTGGGDPRIWYIKYKTNNSAPAKAEAIIQIYGKDFQKNPEAMKSLAINNLLTTAIWLELNQKHKVKQE